jgi:hypothetical protein
MNSNEIFEYTKVRPVATAAELLNHPSFSHVRLNRWGSYWVYFHCSDSPSGVLGAGDFDNTAENCALMAARSIRANLGPSRGDIAASNPCGTVGFGTSLFTGKVVALADPKGLLNPR